jgi:hypothetical protein
MPIPLAEIELANEFNLIRWIDEHSPDGRAVVMSAGAGWLTVRAVAYNRASKRSYESITIIPATVRAARQFLGY